MSMYPIPTVAPKEPSPFEGFKFLSPVIHFKDKRNPSGESPAPMLILCTWMDAPDRLIQRYITQYETLFPTSSIIVVTTSANVLFFGPAAERSTLYRPAVDILCSPTAPPTIAAAVYSNGGVSSIERIAFFYRLRKRKALEVNRMLLDSAPGDPDDAASEYTHRAFYRGLPPFLRDQFPFNVIMSALLWAFIHLWAFLLNQGFASNPIKTLRDGLHDEKRFGKGKRTYVYSKTDDIMPWKGILKSAEEAESQGWQVHIEEFEDSKHVAHAMKDKDRYWKIVEDALEEKQT